MCTAPSTEWVQLRGARKSLQNPVTMPTHATTPYSSPYSYNIEMYDSSQIPFLYPSHVSWKWNAKHISASLMVLLSRIRFVPLAQNPHQFGPCLPDRFTRNTDTINAHFIISLAVEIVWKKVSFCANAPWIFPGLKMCGEPWRMPVNFFALFFAHMRGEKFHHKCTLDPWFPQVRPTLCNPGSWKVSILPKDRKTFTVTQQPHFEFLKREEIFCSILRKNEIGLCTPIKTCKTAASLWSRDGVLGLCVKAQRPPPSRDTITRHHNTHHVINLWARTHPPNPVQWRWHVHDSRRPSASSRSA